MCQIKWDICLPANDISTGSEHIYIGEPFENHSNVNVLSTLKLSFIQTMCH